MDEVNQVFGFLKPIKREVFGGSTLGCVNQSKPKQNKSKPRLTRHDKCEMEEDVEKMRQQIDEAFKAKQVYKDDHDEDEKDYDDVYDRYKFDQYENSGKLPIYSSKQKILKVLAGSPVLILQGSTGCGKTTQVPQIILDDAYAKKKTCNIVVTTPRRIAARAISERVSRERNWKLGSLVGYQVGLVKCTSEDTRLTYCTTGVLLEKLIAMKSLDSFTHIILDEVHERDKDMDFLFILIRMLMCQGNGRTKTKIILMSATINVNQFAEYFKIYDENNKWTNAPVILVEKPNAFSVKNYFIEEFLTKETQSASLKWDIPNIPDILYTLVPKLIKSFKNLDDVQNILSSVLIFLPGIFEITRLHSALNDYSSKHKEEEWEIIILHSLVSSESQELIFQPVKKGIRKIVLSTNIAESSITVPDVKYVIDFCLTKVLKTNPLKNFTSLELEFASRQSCQQRSGRAGRVQDGRCYRMLPRTVFNCILQESSTPELLLSPLANIVLKTKKLNMGAPHVIIGLAMDPPKLENIATTILQLKLLGALQSFDGDDDQIDGRMTFLGQIMADLPISINASRLIALGYCFSVLEECIIMAAALTSQSIFRICFEKNLTSYSRHLEWSNGSGSDLFAAYHAYKIWSRKYTAGEFGLSQVQQKKEKEFCSKHHLDRKSLMECNQLVEEIKKRCFRLGLTEKVGKGRTQWSEEEKSIILKIVISGAFYPNFFSTGYSTSDSTSEKNIFCVLNGRDPNNTVYFSGFPTEFIRELYVGQIKNFFKDTVVDEQDLDKVRVSYDKNSEKVFVTFDSEKPYNNEKGNNWITHRYYIPGRTQPEVYKALKMRSMKTSNFKVSVLQSEVEKCQAVNMNIGILNGDQFIYKNEPRVDVQYLCIPNASVEEIEGTITHVDSCSKFWFQPLSEKERVKKYSKNLNDPQFAQYYQSADSDKIDKRSMLVVRDRKRDRLLRAQVCNVDRRNRESQFNVMFIDFGHKQQCSLDELYTLKLKDDELRLPPRCFECRLAEIEPSTLNRTAGNYWDFDAVELFKSELEDVKVVAKIFSVVNGVTNVFIEKNGLNFNNVLIEKKFGDFSEENYLSKENHWRRKTEQRLAVKNKSYAQSTLESDEYRAIAEAEAVDLPPNLPFYRILQLAGPKSPLESQMFSVLSFGNEQAVKIDPNSVNSVLLNPYQQDFSARYMVAAHISQNGPYEKNKTLSVNETTLLPPLRGFGTLMAMIFCPKINLKRDSAGSRYISVLTGLGAAAGKKGKETFSLFPENDSVFHLDFQLTNGDIAKVNQIRYCISMLLFTLGGRNLTETYSEKSQIEIMEKLKGVIIQLLMETRKPIEVIVEPHKWTNYSLDDSYPPQDLYGTCDPIFPLHWSLKLVEVDERSKDQLRRHCDNLYNLTYGDLQRPIMCKLCATEILNAALLRVHLLSYLHKEREKSIGYSSERQQSVQ